MKEYDGIIDEYRKEGYFMYSSQLSEHDWGKVDEAERYLERFWLPIIEYESKWKGLLERVFAGEKVGLPDMVFRSGFNICVTLGGCLFSRDDFRGLQELISQMGDKEIAVVENTCGKKLKEPCFRMKFPADISWEELSGGNFASAILLEMPHKEYFVFGEGGLWGRYSANDFEIPLDLTGVRTEGKSVVLIGSDVGAQDRSEIERVLPSVYGSMLV